MIIIAQLLVPEPYDWKTKTNSDVAAQGYPNKWVMQVGFIGFDVLLVVNTICILIATRAWRFREISLSTYALAILPSGIFYTQPFINGIPCSELEARLHKLIITTTGICLSIALLILTLTDNETKRKFIHTIFLLFFFAIWSTSRF